MLKAYTGVGSRETPPDVLGKMTDLAVELAARGWWLRSGHAMGADWAFEQGAGTQARIYLPWPGFGMTTYGQDPGRPCVSGGYDNEQLWEENYQLLVEWGIRRGGERQSIRKLQGRNVAQVLGADRQSPSAFCVYWCPEVDGEPQGGTATAVKVAQRFGVPCFNLLHADAEEKLWQWIEDNAGRIT